jgi:hypothetical protein
MSRIFLVGLALIGLAACGGDSKENRATVHAKSTAPVAKRATTQRSSTPKAKTQRKRGARPDTSGQRNPLTNH